MSYNPAEQAERGSAGLCLILGIAGLAVGGYFLIDPTVAVEIPATPGFTSGTELVINAHRLALGQTLSVVGAIFLAAGIRPRRS